MIAVDTNILLYAIDGNDPAKQSIARTLLMQLHNNPTPTLLLWQVLGEVAQQLRRWRDTGRLSSEQFTEHIHVFRHLFPLVLPSADVFDLSQHLASAFQLSHWDSMLVAAAQSAGVTHLFMEDMGSPRKVGGVELLNPFNGSSSIPNT